MAQGMVYSASSFSTPSRVYVYSEGSFAAAKTIKAYSGTTWYTWFSSAPLSMSATDESVCVEGFPAYVTGASWTNTISTATIEVHEDGSSMTTLAAGTSSVTFSKGVVLPGTFDYKARYFFDDGTYGEFSSLATVTPSNPCP